MISGIRGRKFKPILLSLGLLLAAFLVLPGKDAQAWPTNRLDSAGGRSYCTSCHTRTTGSLSIIDVERNSTSLGAVSAITVSSGEQFSIVFRSTGFGYRNLTASAAIRVNNTSAWGIATTASEAWNDNGRTGTTPWTTATQTTRNGAPYLSPYIFTTDFPASDTSLNQRGLTWDNGQTTTPGDRNGLAHNEVFSATLTAPTTPGTYTIYLQGVGTRSDGSQAYNQRAFTVTVNNDTLAPTWPAGHSIAVTSASASSLTVTWGHANDNVSAAPNFKYEVYRKTDSTPWIKVATVNKQDNFTDVDLLSSTRYYYKVKAIDEAENVSGFSAEASGSTTSGTRNDLYAPSAPDNLAAVTASHRVNLSWSAVPEADVVKYRVERSLVSGDYTGATVFTIDAPTTDYIDTDARNGKEYYYRVRAEDVSGKVSPWSAEISAMPTIALKDGINPHGSYTDPKNQDMCKFCHSAHTSKGYQLLKNQKQFELCYSCHDGTGSAYNTKADFNVDVNTSHHRVPEERTMCTDCHNPHFNTNAGSKGSAGNVNDSAGNVNGSVRLLRAREFGTGTLKYSGSEFCWACHGADSELPRPFGLDHQTDFENSAHAIGVDRVTADGNELDAPESGTNIACINCHEAHGSRDYPLLASTNSSNFCINCHKNQSFENVTVAGKQIPNTSNNFVGTIHDTAFYGRNGCLMCHEPHGTTGLPKMLVKKFPENTPYGSVSHTRDELCFTCHDYRYYIGSGRDPIIGSRFGNGNGRNLHWHVTDYRPSCRLCHDPHGGTNQKYDNTATGGSWKLNNPVNVNYDWAYVTGQVGPSGNGRLAFESSGTGGDGQATGYKCYMDCKKDHRPKSYLRNPAQAPRLNCAACHDYTEFEWNSAHPVVYAGEKSGMTMDCTTCHDPDHTKHNTVNPYGLWASVDFPGTSPNPTNTVGWTAENNNYRNWCWNCHGSAATGMRGIPPGAGDIQTHFDGTPHDVMLERPKSPYPAAQDQPCLVCHEHHRSRNVQLLRSDIDTTDEHAIDAFVDTGKINSCLDCHDGYPAQSNINKLYNAPNSAGHFIKGQADKKLLCTECHSPHGTTNDKYLWDRDRYNTGISFPSNKKGAAFNIREFCMACHPASDAGAPRNYDTANTIKVGTVAVQPMPASVVSHSSGSTDSCAMCHDPHKPWPATGSNADCFLCHGNTGEAKNIEALTGWQGTTSQGKVSKHKIFDPNTADTNDCMTMCHTTHPHDPRANNLNNIDEKQVCQKCHDQASGGTQPKIDYSKYNGKAHDYAKTITAYSDGSDFKGNCNKCHTPHGSDYKPLLRWQNGDSLCTQCHNGVATDGNGVAISNIKTAYDAHGHYFKADSSKKLRCAECHVPHGSTNTKYLADQQTTTIYTNGDTNAMRKFPAGLEPGANLRSFCTTCHIPNNQNGTEDYVLFQSSSAPSGSVQIGELPAVGATTGIAVPEHQESSSESCGDCHNAHDPRPMGKNRDCYKCHGGDNSLAQNIEMIAGRFNHPDAPGVNSWPDGAGSRSTVSTIVSFHKIDDGISADTNTCMFRCHTQHAHNPRANLIKDVRQAGVDVTPPAVPTGPSAVATSNVGIDVSWNASTSPDVFGYRIYRDGELAGMVNSAATAGTLKWRDGGVKGMHSYTISAVDHKDNESAKTGAVSASTSYLSDNLPGTVPTGLTGKATGDLRTTMSWSAANDNSGVRGYNIYRSTTSGGPYTKVGYTGKTSFVDGAGVEHSLQSNKTYYYVVTTVDQTIDHGGTGNESAYSAEVAVTTNDAGGTVSSGKYARGSDIVEIMNAAGARTNRFGVGSTVRIKVTTPNVPNFSRARVTLRQNTNNSTITTYNLSRTKSTSPYVYEVSFNAPSTEGLYQLFIEVNDNNGYRINPYESIEVGSTARFRFYTDSTFTTEASGFRPGDTVYAEASCSPGSLGSQYLRIYNWDGTNNTVSGYSSLGINGNYFRFKFTMPSFTVGEWKPVYMSLYNSSGSSILRNYKMIQSFAPDTEAPSAPNLTVTPGVDSASIQWIASTPTDDVKGYTVFRSADNGVTWQKAGSVGSTTTVFKDSGLSPGTSYLYRVSVFDAAGNVATSAVSSVSTLPAELDTLAPATPAGANAAALSETEIMVSWAANAELDKVAGYNVYRQQLDGGSTWNWYKVGTTSTTSFVDKGLKSSTLYKYKVEAFDLEGNVSVATAEMVGQTKVKQGDSLEGALCMSCHDGTGSSYPQNGDGNTISLAYNMSKHNVDYPIKTFSDGSVYYGNCTKCHVPHGSEYSSLLRRAFDNNLCFECHDAASENGKYSGKGTFLTTAHSKTTPSTSGTPKLYPGRPVGDEGKCVNCHTPHSKWLPGYEGTKVIRASVHDGELVGDNVSTNPLCYNCHGTVRFGAWNGFDVFNQTAHGNKNEPLNKWDLENASGECVNCHDPHGTSYGAMLKDFMNTDESDDSGSRKNRVCFKCHNNPTVVSGTYWFQGQSAYENSRHSTNAQWYDSTIDDTLNYVPGNCMNCHTPHGSTDDAGNYIPKQLRVKDSDNSLCYNCHDSRILAEPITDANGDTIGFKSAAPGYPTEYDGAVNPDTLGANVVTPGKTIYEASAHGKFANTNMKWPGGTSYPQASTKSGVCYNCHDPHGSKVGGPTLELEENLCLTCHDGSPSAKNIKTNSTTTGDMADVYKHDVSKYSGAHNTDEIGINSGQHIECADCHNSHKVKADSGTPPAPQASNRIRATKGVKLNYTGKAAGEAPAYTYTTDVVNEYELCLLCHSSYATVKISTTTGRGTTSEALDADLGAQFNPNNKSLHPITNTIDGESLAANNSNLINDGDTDPNTNDGNIYTDTDTMVAGYPRVLKCSDCHYPHGSSEKYLLKKEPYRELCILCHRADVYDQVSGISGTNRGASNFDHTTAGSSHQKRGADEQCRTCHIGSPANGGGIHGQQRIGGDGGTYTGTTLSPANAFISGKYIKGYHESGSTHYCYTSCSKHSSGKSYN